ncbi:ABC transporter permease [Leifsonia sp. Root227]|uniref:ABC transporter permease n=1 Tax=unclassified Leifsonia TaxID=2663824 RepID=UPI0006FBD000|nr:ABC transporter permease [Leifsonia sp. Root227]KRC51746.1 ABC transporter permease [Leifsonia sp. Root227]
MLLLFARRALAAVVLLFAITFVAFLLIYSGGGNVARNILGELATQDQVDGLSDQLGLNQPILVQYATWLGNAIHGDFGVSWFSQAPVGPALLSRLAVTLSIVAVAVALAAIVSVALGMTAAVRGGWLDRVIQLFAVGGEALPNFWIGLFLVSVFAVSLHWFPATGFVPFSTSPIGWLQTITLPVIALVIGGVASGAQQIRGAVIDVLEKDYVRTLRARGLPERSVLLRHVLRNAASPAVTVISLQFIGLLGGVVLIERVFGLPGLGSFAVTATIQGDRPVVMGVLITMSIIVVIVNLIVDLVIGWINPKARIR